MLKRLGKAASNSFVGITLFLASSLSMAQEVTVVGTPPGLRPLASVAHGRGVAQEAGALLRQWPGTYFEAAFVGREVYFQVGAGDVSLRIRADRQPPIPLVLPAPGLYRVEMRNAAGPHVVRIDVASESQGAPTRFGGFFIRSGTEPAPMARRAGQIEFIGDSYTVGYGNTSGSRECPEQQIWATTDTSAGVAPKVAAHYDADYEVNAISGRGVVRNYGGLAADTLPSAYPFELFDKSLGISADDSSWRPRAIVVGLGTNDFSTPLHKGEKWSTREQLHADFESSYVAFLAQLHKRQPQAYLLLWTGAGADARSELEGEVAKVAEQVRRSGNARIGFVPVADLALTGCNYHPSVADDSRIAQALSRHLDAHDVGMAPLPASTESIPAQAANPQPQPAGELAGKLIDDPKTATWSVFGERQTTELVPDGERFTPARQPVNS